MLLTPPLISLFKYAFLGLVVTSAGVLIAHTAVTMQYEGEASEPLPYRGHALPKNESAALDRNSFRCLTHPSRAFCRMSFRKKLRLLKNRSVIEQSGNVTTPIEPHPKYMLMKDFVDLMHSLGVEAVLLEPVMLYCMLSTLQKYYLLANKLHSDSLRDSSNMVTFGVFEKDARVLNQESSKAKSLEMGYELASSGKWLTDERVSTNNTFFFTLHNVTMVVIVFSQRDGFLYYPGVSTKVSASPNIFESSQAYENFIAVPYLLEDGQRTGFFLPSKMSHFLLQIQRSQFEECTQYNLEASPHPTLNLEQLHQRALITIQEMKAILRPMMDTFLLWNETLSGWNESCNVFQKTSEFQIAVSAETLSKLNSTFHENEYLQLVHIQQWKEHYLQLVLDCYGLRVSVSAIHEDHDSVWNFEKNSTGYLTKNIYSKFQLCSISVVGQLVHKPCSKQSL